MKLGIVGQGFVGTAVKEGLKDYHKVETYDKYQTEKGTCDNLGDLVDKSNYIFVCVPTPMKKDGSCDTTTVQSVIYSIAFHAGENRKTIIIKSTVPPGTTEKLNEEYPLFDIVFNPEFLTEANFIEDFKNQDRIIIGGPRPATTKVRQLFSKAFPQVHIIKTSSTIAEMVKYMTNTFLATKVSFANEIYQICERLGVDYDKVVEYSTLDERLGKSHWAVPGPDGHYGFGGSCFPKDINALIKVADELGVPSNVLCSAWDTNLDVRPEEDWKELKGRAVVDE